MKVDAGHPLVVAEGTFEGFCPGDPTNKTVFAGVKADKVVGDVIGSGGGLGHPVTIDMKSPDPASVLQGRLVDRCGEPLSAGNEAPTWTPSPSCANVIKLEHQDADYVTIRSVAPGSCAVAVALLGMTGEVDVTVK